MAINLNPGADATLVGAAYRAGMANTPADYSRTLERAADSYERTMEAQSKMWGSVAKLGASIGVDMMANAKELSDYSALGAGLNPEDAEMFMGEIYANKDAQKELGLFGGRFGDRETRKRRAELKIEQKELFAEIDLAVESISLGTEAVGAGMYDATINEPESEMVNAIIKSNLKDKVTKEGNIAKLTRNETSGELMYTMYRENGEVSMINGKPQTMTIKEFNKSIATNVDDKGAMQAAFSAYNNNRATAGQNSRNGVYDPQMKQMDLNQLDTMLQTPAGLKRAFRTKIGFSNTSFFDDLNTKGSSVSLDLYNSLLSVTGSETTEGELALTGVTEGIVDADNSGGISQQELLNTENYSKLAGNILSMRDPKASTAYFKEYASKEFEKSFNYGYSRKAPAPGSVTGADGIPDFYSKRNKIKTKRGDYLSGGEATGIYNSISAGEEFEATDPSSGKLNIYSYHVAGGEGGWYQNWQEGDTPNTKESYIGPNGGDMGAVFTNDPNFKNIQTDAQEEVDRYGNVIDKDTRQEGTFDPETNLDINFLNKADQNVASSLNKQIPGKGDERNPNNYSFEATGALEQMVSLRDDYGDIVRFPSVYPKGHEKAGKKHPKAGKQAWFRSRGNTTQNTQYLADMIDLLKTFGLYDNIIPMPE